KSGTACRTAAGLTLIAVSIAGCGVTPGSRSAFPEPHRLLAAARDIRDTAPEVPDVPRELDKHVLPPYTVEPGDVLLIQPCDLDSPVRLPADQPVLTDGTINLGRFGRPVVAGKTVEEIEALVRALIEAQVPASPCPLTVRIVVRQSKVFYVLGEVN